ncbi:MAG: hypothetical protein ACRD03_07170 [Acidimicrobiales bacterium]
MRAYEHRSIGDAATGGATVNLGGESGDERFELTYGDVVALSGDFFRPDGPSTPGVAGEQGSRASECSGRLFDLAMVAGEAGGRPASRDEIVGALKVAAVDEAVPDRRFEPGGRFAGFRFSAGADRSEVERRVRDRYLTLAANNDDHFVAPGRSDSPTGSGFGSALEAYRRLHEAALDEARRLGRRGGDISRAMAREAAAQHYLTDAFAAGHLRTPVADIRRYWKARYPAFWAHLQRKVAADTATALRDLSAVMRLVPRRVLQRRTLSELTIRTCRYPELSVGDLVARVFHDWDNDRGLTVEGGGVVFGDGRIDDGATKKLALAGVRAGLDDIEAAFALGSSGRRLRGQALYRAVRRATGANGDRFLAETAVPRLSPANPVQNWLAPDVETLWTSPVVGATGTTVGEALVTMLEPDGQFIRQVEGLGQGLAGDHGVFALPVVGAWLSGKCCRAYHRGFVEPLAHDPRAVVWALLEDGPRSPMMRGGAAAGPTRAPVPLARTSGATATSASPVLGRSC